jgi:hypothetical protein
MNTTLPPTRDLPSKAHARIRARVELAVIRRRRPWLAPALSGATALILIAFFAWPAPAPRGDDPAAGPTRPPTGATATSPPTGERPVPTLPGVSPERRAQIEQDCDEKHADVIPADEPVLYQLIKDAAGESALLYTPDGQVWTCRPNDLDKPHSMYGSSAVPLDWLPGPVSVDVLHDFSYGGDVAGEKRPGFPGLEAYGGRVTSDVARVTVTISGATHQAVVANGTFYLRIVHPSDWKFPDPPPAGVLRAYDEHGTVLAEGDLWDFRAPCTRLPNGQVAPEGEPIGSSTCVDGVFWR